jgi:hypothetical protein
MRPEQARSLLFTCKSCGRNTDKLGRIWKETFVAEPRYHLGICVEGEEIHEIPQSV